MTFPANYEFGSKCAWQECSLDLLGDAGMGLVLDALEGSDAWTRTSPPSMGQIVHVGHLGWYTVTVCALYRHKKHIPIEGSILNLQEALALDVLMVCVF